MLAPALRLRDLGGADVDGTDTDEIGREDDADVDEVDGTKADVVGSSKFS